VKSLEDLATDFQGNK